LQSTARGGKLSRIVPMLKEGSMVTVPRTLSDIVVSEYGIAGCAERRTAKGLWS